MNASSAALLALPALAVLWVVLAITGRARRRTLRARAELHVALAAEKREAERPAAGTAPELHVRVLAEDTLETLTVRVMQEYEEHGLLLGVAEARQLAEIALAKRDGRPG